MRRFNPFLSNVQPNGTKRKGNNKKKHLDTLNINSNIAEKLKKIKPVIAFHKNTSFKRLIGNNHHEKQSKISRIYTKRSHRKM